MGLREWFGEAYAVLVAVATVVCVVALARSHGGAPRERYVLLAAAIALIVVGLVETLHATGVVATSTTGDEFVLDLVLAVALGVPATVGALGLAGQLGPVLNQFASLGATKERSGAT